MSNTIQQKKRGPVAQYFADVWAGIATTYLGMRLTIRYFMTRPITMQYPEVKPVIPASHRGLHGLDESKCTLCQMCVKNCPVECIELEGLGRARDTFLLKYDVDYSKCLFCNICAEVCPTSCVRLTEKYNLASATRDECVLHLVRPKSEAEIEDFKQKQAQKEAERKEEAERKAKLAAEKNENA